MMKKLIFVTYPIGREGTSALMGLLNAMGVPPVKNFKDIRNPRGFFEDPAYFKMLHRQFPLCFEGVNQDLPSFDAIQGNVDEHIDEFKLYLKKAFRRRDIIAIKSPKFLCLFQAAHLQRLYDVRIVTTGRENEAIVRSLTKMWSQRPEKERVLEEDIQRFVEQWQGFQQDVITHFEDYPMAHTSFEELISHPYEVARELAIFIDIPCPSQQVMDDCIDSRLVSRRKYKSGLIQWGLFKLHNLGEKVRTSF